MKQIKNKINSPTKRLATSEEKRSLFIYLANENWKTCVIYTSSFGYEDVKLGYAKYLKKELKDYENTIGSTIIVDHFEDCNILLYSYLYSFLDKKTNDNYISTNMILRVGNIFKEVSDLDYFNLDREIESLSKTRKKTAGRPKRPSDKSVIKTHNIKNLITKGVLVDDACKQEGLAKSTYYRVSKWIIKNSAYESFPK